ncbi:MAG: tetratricopeptide repeat protein, partial [Thermomicrobiales bacterium]
MPWHSPFRRRENADPLRAAGDIARDQRDWQTAASHYSSYLELKPEDAAIWVQLGHCRKEGGNRDGAERAYLRALSIEPNNPDTHVQMGHIEKMNGRPDQALAWYRKAILIDPGFAPAIHEATQLSLKAPSGRPNMNETAGDVDATIAAAIARRIQPLTDQIGAIKAVAVELQ